MLCFFGATDEAIGLVERFAGWFQDRRTPEQIEHAIASKSTLDRLEHGSMGEPTRYHEISHDAAAIERLFTALFLDAHHRPPQQIVLDLEATDDPLHSRQEGRFLHGHDNGHLPLPVFGGRHLLAAKPRRSNIDASAGAVEEIEPVITPIRQQEYALAHRRLARTTFPTIRHAAHGRSSAATGKLARSTGLSPPSPRPTPQAGPNPPDPPEPC